MAAHVLTEFLREIQNFKGKIFSKKDHLQEFSDVENVLFSVAPATVEEIQKIVNFSRARGLGLVPVSSEPPHMRDGTAPEGQCIVLDLRGFKRIVQISRRHRVVVVEPGVTFEMLVPALKAEGLRPLMPLLPRGGKSVLAAALDREPVTLPRYQWDSADPLRCVEVVFGNGEVFRTGEACGEYSLEWVAQGKHLPLFPLGPHQVDYHRLVQGAQGGMGIVTWGTLAVALLPEVEEFYFVESDNLSQLAAFANRLIKLELADYTAVLNRSCLASALSKKDFLQSAPDKYFLLFSLSGLQRRPQQRLAYVKNEVASLSRQWGLELKSETSYLSSDELEHLFTGTSPGRFWKGGLGTHFREVFFLTTASKVDEMVDVFVRESTETGFSKGQLGVYVQHVFQATSMEIQFVLFHEDDEKEQVDKWERVLVDKLLEKGAFFSRPYFSWRRKVLRQNPVYFDVLMKIKRVFDPAGILNPGKLGEV